MLKYRIENGEMVPSSQVPKFQVNNGLLGKRIKAIYYNVNKYIDDLI